MGSIVIDNLKSKAKDKTYLYTDIEFDLSIGKNINPSLNSNNTVVDLVVDHDIEAIKNSLLNLFTTIPGQKILNPIYGLNLAQFLFSGITESNSRLMGEVILRGITTFEPRITVKKIYIFPDPENHTYEIALRLDVPSLNITGLTLKGTLSESGYFIK